MAKKQREFAQYAAFAASYANAPKGILSQPNPPEPDIVIESADGPVAIELTEFALGDNRRRAAESEQARTLARAQALYESDQRPPVHVSVGWAWHLPLVDAERCAERLSRLVANHAPTGNGWEHLDPAPGELSREWPITRISIARASRYIVSEWRDGDMHQVDAVTADAIKSRIALEDVKVARYCREYVARWLVLVKGAAGPSTWGFVTGDASAARYDSLFDKVFLLELDHHRCHELSSDSGTARVVLHRPAS